MNENHYAHGLVLAAILVMATGTAFAGIHNVRDYGATGNRETNDRAAIQKAIDACAQAGGGTVYFPAGDYLSGKLWLRSHVTLHLDAGATLWASTAPEDYESDRRDNLLAARDVDHIAILGRGRIHGQGTEDYGRGRGSTKTPAFRTGILLFENCRNITIRDITILYSDAWTVHLKRCDTVVIDGVTIRNNYWRTNSDGIDPNMCRNVHISNCHIVAGDDCIVMKATEEESCENVVVTNCTLETIATAVKLGTESRGDFRNIHVSNCTIRNTPVGIGFYMKDGATMEQMTFANISMETTSPAVHRIYPIFMDIEKRHDDSTIGKIRDVTFRDMTIRSGSGALIQGMPESPIENLTLENITFRVTEANDYSDRRKTIGGRRTTRDERDTLYARQPAYLTLAHIDGLQMENIRVLIPDEYYNKFPRAAVSLHEVENGSLCNIARTPAGEKTDMPVARMENCRGLLVTGCRPAQGTPALLGLTGEETADIALLGNDLRRIVRPVTIGDGAGEKVVRLSGNLKP